MGAASKRWKALSAVVGGGLSLREVAGASSADAEKDTSSPKATANRAVRNFIWLDPLVETPSPGAGRA